MSGFQIESRIGDSAKRLMTEGKWKEAGELIASGLDESAGVRWCAHLLRTGLTWSRLTLPLIDEVVKLLDDPAMWKHGRRLQSECRKEFDVHEMRGSLSGANSETSAPWVYSLAIIAARVAFNASHPEEWLLYDDDTIWDMPHSFALLAETCAGVDAEAIRRAIVGQSGPSSGAGDTGVLSPKPGPV